MNLKEFREHTKDLPDDATIWVLGSNAWKSPLSIKIHTESLRYCEGHERIPEDMKNQVEVRLELSKD